MAVPSPPAGRPRHGPAWSPPASLAARVEGIVTTAERETAVIQRDLEAHRRASEAEAQRHLEEARRQAEALVGQRAQRLRELADEVLERAEATRRHFDGLIGALERATTRLADDPVLEPDLPRRPGDRPSRSGLAAHGVRSSPAEAVAPAGAGGDEPPRPAEAEGLSAASLEAARLVAIEMAVAGRTRSEVDAHLRESFRVSETSELLDDVFGEGGGESTRTSWVTPSGQAAPPRGGFIRP